MKITLMCAVPSRRIDGGPCCSDGRGGQIYHGATPAFFVKDPSAFWIGVVPSFLLDFEDDEIRDINLEYIVATARRADDIIGVTRNDFALFPFKHADFGNGTSRMATYENVPVAVECSCTERGLIEVSFELKLDAHPLPLKVCRPNKPTLTRRYRLNFVAMRLKSPEHSDALVNVFIKPDQRIALHR